MSVLNTADIYDIFNKLKMRLNGVYAKDQLAAIQPKLGYYIINLDDSTGEGTHWVCCGIKHQSAFYFDSYGLACPPDIRDFLRKTKKTTYENSKQIQNYSSTNCGWYCIACCHYIDKHRDQKLYEAYKDFVGLFTDTHSKHNDKILKEYFEKYL